jgi:DNA topoisomerase IB
VSLANFTKHLESLERDEESTIKKTKQQEQQMKHESHPLKSLITNCWGLVLKCYELRTRQHKMLNNNALRPLKHYLPKDLMNFGRRPQT